MNRRDRRRHKPRDPLSAKHIHELQHRVDQTGRPGIIYGLTHACRDCTATGSLLLLPGRRVIGNVYHDEHCPAATGITPWEPHPLDEGTQPA